VSRPRGRSRQSGSIPWLLGAALVLGAPPLPATVPTDGTLVANRACPAPSSIKRGTNAGDIRLTPGERYRVVGRNREDATHYLVEIGTARPAQRWVAVDCGRLEPAGAPAAAPAPPPAEPIPLILAISWQNAFCEVHPGKPECRTLGPRDAAASRFSLHGLWPQPRSNAYCGVAAADRAASSDGDWERLPRLALTPATRARLDALMPGTRSALQRHEWTKHGSCYGADPETYFDDSLDLLDQVNASPARTLFADHVGRHLRAARVREAFTRAFGPGAGERVRLDCDDGMISELRISLKGAPGDTRAIGEMMRAAPAKSVGCRGGRVEAAGSGRH
jgi:ribonuclease T2